MKKIIILLFIIIFLYFIYKNIYIECFNNIEKIPKIIIQTWKNHNLPEHYYKYIESIHKYNPTYTYLYFTDNDIINFLQNNYPNYYDTYLKLPVMIQKIDFFRYIAIYHYGGIYLDIDIECLKSFDPLLKYNSVFGIDLYINKEECNYSRYTPFCDIQQYFFIGQYAFAAEKHNNFIKILIDNIHNNIENIINEFEQLDNKINNDYVYRTTGPDYISKLYNEYENKELIKILYTNDIQVFGEYAIHHFNGTWK
jgi:mannosyltransferase OCH1-like enzyme